MPTSVQTAIANKTAAGVVEGVELAAPLAGELAKHKARSVVHSRSAHVSGAITGGLVFAFSYAVVARRRRIKRIEAKLDHVVEKVIDEDG